VSAGTLEDVVSLDFKTPFDELAELRAVLTTQEIAEFTGLRRETISRARPDGRFRRRTEKALGDLYLVVTRMRTVMGEEHGQLAAILRRPQAELSGRSIAELLRSGEVDVVLKSLSELDAQVAAVLDTDPELRRRLGAIEAALVEHFGPEAKVERKIISDYEEMGESDQLYLHVRADLSLDEKIDRLRQFLRQEEDLLAPVRRNLVVGFL
jgi:hypothetical protein